LSDSPHRDEHERPRRLVHHAPLKRWSPISREERKATRAFVRRLTEFPFLTLGMVVFLGWAFAVQLVVGWPFTLLLAPDGAGDALLAEVIGNRLGWLDQAAVFGGEGWRLVSATMLHGSLLHIAGNCAVLYLLGRIIENVYGRSAFLVTYVGAGVAGTGLSVIVSGNNSLGASGAILGMLGASLALGIRYKRQIPKPLRDYFGTDMWVFVILVAAMSLLPFVDWAGHLGGFLWGLGVGLVWPPELFAGRPGPKGRAIGSVLAGAAAGAMVFTVLVVGQRVVGLEGAAPQEDLRAFVAAWERQDEAALVRIAQRMSDDYEDAPGMQFELARVFLLAGEYQLAVDTFVSVEDVVAERAIDDTWQNDVAWAMFLAAPDDPDQVDDGLRRSRLALAADPDNPGLRNTLAYGLLLDGQFEEAERLSAELMLARPEEERQVDVYIHVQALAGVGRGDDAVTEYRKYAGLFPAEPGLLLADIAVIKAQAEADLVERGLLPTEQ
jgi:membrane associated rhomboid family serine protease